jgi:hypothetical protein
LKIESRNPAIPWKYSASKKEIYCPMEQWMATDVKHNPAQDTIDRLGSVFCRAIADTPGFFPSVRQRCLLKGIIHVVNVL